MKISPISFILKNKGQKSKYKSTYNDNESLITVSGSFLVCFSYFIFINKSFLFL